MMRTWRSTTCSGAGRLTIRDYIDLIHLHRTYLRLRALAWAGTGKDPGLSPLLILNELNRHTRYQPEARAEVRLREAVSLPALKLEWLKMLRTARELVERLPAREVCAASASFSAKPWKDGVERPHRVAGAYRRR